MAHVKLFDQLKQLSLGLQDYAVFGSGPLVIRKVIPTANDLDVICRGTVWTRVCQIGKIEYLAEYNVNIVNLPGCAITFGTAWGIGNFNIDELIDTAEVIEGLPFVRLKHVVSYKKIRASEKDVAHLEALRTFSNNLQ